MQTGILKFLKPVPPRGTQLNKTNAVCTAVTDAVACPDKEKCPDILFKTKASANNLFEQEDAAESDVTESTSVFQSDKISQKELHHDADDISSEGSTEISESRKVPANSIEGASMLTFMESKRRSPLAQSETIQISGKKKKKKGSTLQEEPPKTGSLFACLTSGATTEALSDLASPKFSPACFDFSSWFVSREDQQKKRSLDRFIRFSVLSETFDKIEELKFSGSGSKRSVAVILSNFFRLLIFNAREEELIASIYICLNKVAPEYLGVEVGVGESIIVRTMAETYGRSESNIKKDLAHQEDLGSVAASSSCSVRTLFPMLPLTIRGVFNELKAMSECSGSNSQLQKKEKIKKLLVSARGSESKYIIRFLQQKMRIGIQSATVYQAVAFAFCLTAPRISSEAPVADCRSSQESLDISSLEKRLNAMEKAVRTALCEMPNIDSIVHCLFSGADESSLPNLCNATPGIPVQPMLAKPTKGINEVFERFSNESFTCEFKYDGERAQVHLLERNRVKIFSRNMEDITEKYPDIISIVLESISPGIENFIIDCEVVAIGEGDKILPFQVLSTRKRKQVSASEIDVRVCLFPFDAIFLSGNSLIKETLKYRRKKLFEILKPLPGRLKFVESKETSSMEDVDFFLQEAVEASCEGLMIKALEENSSYEPSKRSLNWLKIKKDYIQDITDTVDLVPIGAYLGKGRRSGWYGAYILAVWNPENETFQSVCKAGTGFSDGALEELSKALNETVISRKKQYYEVSEKMEPDVWFEASQVWECRAADLSLSPIHTAGFGSVSSGKGIGLRFPRFIRKREDKNPENATTDIQIVDMYRNQFRTPSGVLERFDPEDDLSDESQMEE